MSSEKSLVEKLQAALPTVLTPEERDEDVALILAQASIELNKQTYKWVV